MKIMITILRKNGECRTWTNASAEEIKYERIRENRGRNRIHEK